MKTLKELKQSALTLFNEHKEEALKEVRRNRTVYPDATELEIPLCYSNAVLYFMYSIKNDRFERISFDHKEKVVNIEV